MEQERAVAVEGPSGRGSGYSVGPRLVLTSAHVVRDAATVEVYKPGSAGTYRGRVVWRGTSGGRDDAALVQVTDERWNPPGDAAARWGRLVTSLPEQRCETWGVPEAAQEGQDYVEARHETGWINPGSGVAGNRYVMSLKGTPPTLDDRPGLPWGGLSGGAVLMDRMVVGVVVAESRHFGHGEVQVVPAYMLHLDPDFRAALERYGADSLLLEPAEFRDLVDERSVDLAGPKGSPSALLQAERQVVGFHGRDGLLEELVAWCREDGLSAVLLHAPGGQGKTRLVRELGRRLTDRRRTEESAPDGLPWAVVWLRTATHPGDLRLETLRETVGPLLVVIDYVEGRLDQLSLLLEAVRERRVPFKLLLVARTAGSWWEQARKASRAAEDLLGVAPVVELPPLAEQEGERAARYREAAEAFARELPNVRGYQGPDWPALAAALPVPDLSRAGFENILTLHMTALADLLDRGTPTGSGTPSAGPGLASRSPEPDDVETRVLGHESRYWSRTLKLLGYQDGAPEGEAFKDALAAAILLGPEDRRQADGVLRRVPGLPGELRLRGDVDRWIATLYPPDGTGRRPWGTLQPDRLAERFVGERVLQHWRLAPALVDGIDRAEAERFLTVLARAAHHRPLVGRLAPLLAELCTGHPDALALPAIAVATQVEEPEPILHGLRDLLDAPSTTAESLAAWAAAVPDFSYNLGPWAVTVLKRLVEARRTEGGGTPEEVLTLAGYLRGLSRNLSEVGAQTEALAEVDEAIALLRQLAKEWDLADPHGVRARNGLAACLNNRANFLGELGRRQEALEAAEEAVRVFRQLETDGTLANPTHLLRSLATLAIRQQDLGFGREALATAEEVVERRRHRARTGAEDDLADLATGLNNLSLCHTGEGRHVSALERSQEAVDLLRPLAERKPDAYRPLLALVLGTMSSCLGDMGRAPEALAAVREAVEVRRRLAERRPDAYTADLAMSLNNLAIRLAEVGHGSEALAAIEESVALYRVLAETRPAAHTDDLARALNGLANELADAGDQEGALRAAEEAAELYGELHRTLPDVFAADHAMALVSLGNHSGEAGLADEALAAPVRALEIYRSLPEDQAVAARPDLAKCLNNIGAQLRSDGRPDEALIRIEESVALGRELAEASPGAFRTSLARYLTHQATCLQELDRLEESVPIALEAVEVARPHAGLPEPASLLNTLSRLLLAARRSTEALAAVEAIVAARRRLAEMDPLRHRPSLADSLHLFTNQLGRLGRLSDAVVAAEEVVVIRRHLRDTSDTDAERARLAQALGQFGNLLVRADRQSEAIDRVAEAVALWRGLPEPERAAHATESATALTAYAGLLWTVDRADESLAALTEAAACFQLLPETEPIHHAGTAMTLTLRGSFLSDLDDPAAVEVLERAVAAARSVGGTGIAAFENIVADALAALAQCRADTDPPQPGALEEATEAIELYDRLVEAEPAVYGPGRARTLPTLGICLAQAGHTGQALAVGAEAVQLARQGLADGRNLADMVLAGALLSLVKVHLLVDHRLDVARTDLDEAIVLLEHRAEHEPALVAPALRKATELRGRLTARSDPPE
ncbi:tetratricopeptide repeat protein [Kitasatospora sp. NPDC057015]|uniref:tetratricopeptide repeat protein n=1 Tax=Kitasatospora sp. NPDC057015 TaxID=3346001 RepID=UPI00363F5ED7